MINQSNLISNRILTRMQAALHLLKAVDGDNRKLMPLPVDNSKQRSKVLLVSSFANITALFICNILICRSNHMNICCNIS